MGHKCVHTLSKRFIANNRKTDQKQFFAIKLGFLYLIVTTKYINVKEQRKKQRTMYSPKMLLVLGQY